MNHNPYQPLACGLYDQLELWAIRGKRVELVFLENEMPITLHTRITNLFSEADAEYLRTDSGETIRLDALYMVDAIPFR
ncbi:MAG TPA: hypothetical protein PLL64_10120 [Rhodothermales bacterium]|nr:hypothetical protein [Bacteroidota bacterium]HRK74621.1 hypothetical protein [Rhodothermales bacterium]HRR09962.1 hypothetical protein [Rhodothermales bacterium]